MSRHKALQHIDPKLIKRLRMFVLIALIMLGIVCYQIAMYAAPVLLVIWCVIVGVLIGLVAGRMHKISRDEEWAKIIAKMDRTGVIILVAYICLAIGRKYFLSQWVHGHALLATTLAVAVGNMIGRLITMRYGIRKILSQRMADIFGKG